MHNYTHEVEIRTHVCSKSQCFSSYMYIHTQNGTFHEGVIVLTLGYNDDGQHQQGLRDDHRRRREQPAHGAERPRA